MSQFSLHFFKKGDRNVDLKLLKAFFETREDFEIKQIDDRTFDFIYTHPRLQYQAVFRKTRSSQVPNLYRIDPAFLDINIRVDISVLSPDYFAHEVFTIAEELADKFGFFAYYEAFDNPKKMEIDFILAVFSAFKRSYFERNPQIRNEYHILDKQISNAILRYIDELPQLQNYYRDLEVFVPKYHILKDAEGELVLAMEWRENTATVFPPHIDYIFYRSSSEVKVLRAEEVFDEIDEYLEPVPGFIKETSVINRSNIKRATKQMKKMRYPRNRYSFSKESLQSIVD